MSRKISTGISKRRESPSVRDISSLLSKGTTVTITSGKLPYSRSPFQEVKIVDILDLGGVTVYHLVGKGKQLIEMGPLELSMAIRTANQILSRYAGRKAFHKREEEDSTWSPEKLEGYHLEREQSEMRKAKFGLKTSQLASTAGPNVVVQ